jgi:hypothetical protein
MALLHGQERPRARDVQRELGRLCARIGARAPSRATIYNALARCRAQRYVASELPASVRLALYNIADDAELDGAQVAFYAFNYGDLSAACWAAGMPWLALHGAARMRGWRPKSRGLLLAAMRRRRIT